MAIPVKLQVFEGPLDLLLHLIDKNKIDIYDIPIAEITDQYLAYVRQMDREDMDVTSEFMLMAATLIDIKCRMLLPKEKDEEIHSVVVYGGMVRNQDRRSFDLPALYGFIFVEDLCPKAEERGRKSGQFYKRVTKSNQHR